MELYRDEKGFLDISKLVDIESNGINYNEFDLNGNHYYFKYIHREDMLYNELIAEEIAKEIGIECCHYDLAKIDDEITGVISESRENEYDKVETFHELFKDIPDKYGFGLYLEDIWDIMELKYKDKSIVKRFIEDYVKLFMFDSIIGNPDRHCSNTLIGYKDNIPYLYPVFDNATMCSPSSILRGYYAVGVDNGSYKELVDRFIEISSSEYRDLFKEYLEVINESNIQDILNRVETRIQAKIPDTVKNRLTDAFKTNYNNISQIMDKDISRRRR